jgi:hypothetical protein
METFSRRDILIKGGLMLVSAAAGFNKIGHDLPDFTNTTHSSFFSSMFNSKDYAFVKSVSGSVHVNHLPLVVGSKVPGDVLISIERKSNVILSLPDLSIFTINGKTQIQLDRVLSKERLFRRCFSSLPQIESKRQSKGLNINGQKANMNLKGNDLSLSINFVV